MIDLLLIEDNSDFLTVLKEAIEINGHRVRIAHDGEEGLAYLNDGYQPAIIVCDISLPHMDGLEFIRRLRANPAWAKVIVVAMSGNQDFKREALALGANHYLVKPFSFNDLFHILAQVEPPKK
jgi:CheY-like chemotaxis protein